MLSIAHNFLFCCILRLAEYAPAHTVDWDRKTTLIALTQDSKPTTPTCKIKSLLQVEYRKHYWISTCLTPFKVMTLPTRGFSTDVRLQFLISAKLATVFLSHFDFKQCALPLVVN